MNTDFKILDNLKSAFFEFLPLVLGILAFILISWLLLKVFMYVLKRFLKVSRLDLLNKKINKNEFIQKLDIEINLSLIIQKIVKLLLILIILLVGADLFGIDKLSDALLSFLLFFPNLIVAIAIVVMGLYLATFLKDNVKNILKSFDLSGSNLISSIVFVIILFTAFIIALNQLGINTEIITNNLSIILGAALLAFTIALGLGSKDVILRLIFGFYTRKNIQVGKTIQIDDTKGVVVAIDNICVVLKTDTSKIVYPIKTIVNKKIIILDE